jgi:excisionase family DNA binding protein
MAAELSTRSSGTYDEKLLTSKQIADVLGVTHHKTVERWAREEGLPCVRLKRNLRFRLGDVLRWRSQQES